MIFGGAGKYKLTSAMTGYMVTPMDQMGNPLDMKAGADDPVFGSGAEADDAATPSAAIIVNGVSVMTNADLGKCTGTEIDGPWTVAHLTGLIPEASAGGKDFAGLDAVLDPMMNASPGWVKFGRTALTCKKDYGDGDSANLSAVENPDGVPVEDERTYTAGTLIVEEKTNDDRAFVTTGRALLKFITSDSTFAASWTLKSPASGTSPTDEDGDLTKLGQVFSSKAHLSISEGRSTDRDEPRGEPDTGSPLSFFAVQHSGLPGLPLCPDCDPSRFTSSSPISRGHERRFSNQRTPAEAWGTSAPARRSLSAGNQEFYRMLIPNGQCGGRIFSTAVLLAAVATAAQSMAADPREWRLLSRAQVNPPGVQAFVETFFSHNQLKADPEGDLVLGFPAVSRCQQGKGHGRLPVPIRPLAGCLDSARSRRRDRRAGTVAGDPDRWKKRVRSTRLGSENKRQKPGGPRSELRIGYRRSDDEGATWTRTRYFGVGTALARRAAVEGRWPRPSVPGRFQWLPRRTGTHPSVSELRRRQGLAPGGRQFP